METWQQEQAIEVLQQAAAMEVEGVRFYRELAGRTQNPQGRSMFEFLVRDEESHLDKLQAEIKALQGGRCLDPSSFEKEDAPRDRDSFFARAREEILPGMKQEFTDLEALKLALELENRGYAFYEGQAGKATDPMLKGIWHYLRGQEAQHRQLLVNTLTYLGAPLDWFGKEERHIFEGG
jgi:rubrerythrin